MNKMLEDALNLLAGQGAPATAMLASYVLSHTQSILSETVISLAEKAGVSYATVCRFTRALGFDRFGEFKRSITQNDDTQLSSTDIPLSDTPTETDPVDVIHSVCDMTVAMAANCRFTLKPAILEKVCEYIIKADNIYLVGLGTSSVSVNYAYIKLFRLGINCRCDSDSIIMRMQTSMLGKNDLLFAISSSGRTKGILDMARLARKSGVKIISISDFTASPLARLSDIAINTSLRDSSANPSADLPLIEGQLTMIDIIYTYLYSKLGGDCFCRTKESVFDEKDIPEKNN